jgi:hypothetical protein
MAMVGCYVGLAWKLGFVQAEEIYVDNLIRLLGGQFKMRDSRLTPWVYGNLDFRVLVSVMQT